MMMKYFYLCTGIIAGACRSFLPLQEHCSRRHNHTGWY